MAYKTKQVPSITGRLDETIRFPYFGELNADFVTEDESDRKVGQARVTKGVIEVLAVANELDPRQRKFVMNELLRMIVSEADVMNANLSIEINPVDLQEMKRFLERYGFKGISETVLRRAAGSIKPPLVS